MSGADLESVPVTEVVFMPQVLWHRTRPPIVETFLLLALFVAFEVYLRFAPGWLLLARLSWAGAMVYLSLPDVALVLAAGVLTTFRIGPGEQRIPLAVADVVREGDRFLITWPEGGRQRRRRVRLSESFGAALERAAASARSAEPGAVPRTRLEAQRVAVFAGVLNRDPQVEVLVALLLLVIAVAFYFDGSLFVLALLMPTALRGTFPYQGLILLEDDRLWLFHPTQAMRMVPLTAVTAVTQGLSVGLVKADDPDLPVLRLDPRWAGTIIRRLKSSLALRQGGGSMGEGAPQTVRCALCGRPEAVTSAKERVVFVCERCAGKVRYEAAEGGHGLLGKEPRPL